MTAKVEGVFTELKLIDSEQQTLYASIDSQATENSSLGTLLRPVLTFSVVNNT